MSKKKIAIVGTARVMLRDRFDQETGKPKTHADGTKYKPNRSIEVVDGSAAIETKSAAELKAAFVKSYEQALAVEAGSAGAMLVFENAADAEKNLAIVIASPVAESGEALIEKAADNVTRIQDAAKAATEANEDFTVKVMPALRFPMGKYSRQGVVDQPKQDNGYHPLPLVSAFYPDAKVEFSLGEEEGGKDWVNSYEVTGEPLAKGSVAIPATGWTKSEVEAPKKDATADAAPAPAA